MIIQEFEAKYLTGDYLLKQEFEANDDGRGTVLQDSEKYAGWTLPRIFPISDLDTGEETQHDYQSTGAQAVTHLANKLMMALFQPAKPFFRMKITPEQQENILAGAMKKAQLEEAMATAERECMEVFDEMKGRVALYTCLLQLIITGNSLLYAPTNGDMEVYSLRDYVIKRDPKGDPMKMILKEVTVMRDLPEHLWEMAAENGYQEDDEIAIYTGIMRVVGADKTRWVEWQEMEAIGYAHNRMGIYPESKLPWIPLTWSLARGQDYGSGMVEDYAGAFHSLSNLSEAELDYTSIVTDVKVLVNPTGMTDVKDVQNAASGDYVQGREEDLFVHTANVQGNVDFLTQRGDRIERRIATAFLMNSQITRDAERVTAEEIRMQANELESSLGGVYSRLALELQLPLARILMRRLNPEFQKVKPTVVTGFEALSRNSELSSFRAFITDLVALRDVPDDVRMRLDMESVVSVLGTGHGVEYKKFLKSNTQVQREQAAAQQSQARQVGMEQQAVNQANQGAG